MIIIERSLILSSQSQVAFSAVRDIYLVQLDGNTPGATAATAATIGLQLHSIKSMDAHPIIEFDKVVFSYGHTEPARNFIPLQQRRGDRSAWPQRSR